MPRPNATSRQLELAGDLKRRIGQISVPLARADRCRPIAFRVELVRAILDGRKTQTRRLADSIGADIVAGTTLWVREKWARVEGGFHYAADGERAGLRYFGGQSMPRDAARLFLKVNAVRFECIRDLTPADALAEGAPPNVMIDQARRWFESLWRSIYPSGPESWDANPRVAVIEFEAHRAGVIELRSIAGHESLGSEA